MTIVADRPRDLLRRALNEDLPLVALRSIVDLRRALERLEVRAVTSARAKGATWAEIAGTLGITRQALHQRLRRLRGTTPAG
jgi:hypothetical protein